jgi:hypothetical protein
VARIETDPNYTGPTFSRATAATDLFKKEDVQQLAAAVSTHVHDGVHGLPLVAGSIPAGSITSAMIADGTIVAGDIADGTITSAKIADGTIVAADIANATITNAKLGTDVARANLLTNGGFEIWQRGNGPFTATGAYSADRWFTSLGSGASTSISKTSGGSGPSGGGSNVAMVTHTQGAGGSTLTQRLVVSENALKGQILSASLRGYPTVAGALSFYIQTDGTAPVTSPQPSASTINTWQTLTATLPGPVPNDATYVQFVIVFNATGTFYVDNAMLVVGSQPCDYVPLHPADDLARCLRYYQRWNQLLLLPGQTGSATNFAGPIPLLATLATTPTLTVSAASDWQVLSGGTFHSVTAVSLYQGAVGAASVTVTCTGTTAGQGALLAGATGNAWLALEANPLLIPMGLLMMQGAQPDYVVYGVALIAAWMVSMNAERTADLTRQLRQLPGLDRLIDCLRSPAASIRAVALRMFRPVLP